MSHDLEQLFRDNVPAAPTSRVDLDTVVRRGRSVRRRQQVRTTATIGVTGALVVGIGALAASAPSSTGPSPTSGGGALGRATPAIATPSASVATPVDTPVPTPVASSGAATPVPTPVASSGGIATPVPTTSGTSSLGYAPTPVPSTAPADLRAVTLPDPAPVFGPRRLPDSVDLISGLNLLPESVWVANFEVGDESGAGKAATVYVGDFPLPATSGTPTLGETPGPITGTPVVAGHQAYVTHDGSQTILYFRTARFTVQVCGWHATVADLVTLAESLRGIE